MPVYDYRDSYRDDAGQASVARRAAAPTGSAGHTSRKKKKKKKKMNATLLTTFVLFGIGILAVLVYFVFFAGRERTITMTETPALEGMTHLNTGSGMLYQAPSDGLGSFNYYDWTRSKRNYTYNIEVNDLKMNGSDGISVVYTEDLLLIVDTLQQVQMTGTILSVECGTDHIAVLRRDSVGGESLLILSKNGEQVDQLLADGQYIVNFGFYSTTTEMLWMQTLSVSAGSPVTVITTYDLSKRTSTGVMEVQDQLVEGLYFTNNSIFVAGTNQIIRYTYDGNKETYKEMIYGYEVLDFSYASGTPTFLLGPREGNMNSIRILTLNEAETSGATSTYLQLPGEGVAGYIMNGALVVVTEENLYSYTLKGSLSSTSKLDRPVQAAEKISDSLLLFLSNATYCTGKV